MDNKRKASDMDWKQAIEVLRKYMENHEEEQYDYQLALLEEIEEALGDDDGDRTDTDDEVEVVKVVAKKRKTQDSLVARYHDTVTVH